ncbi:MAG: peptidoglycan DD-metalloendopeptidase family protein [Candidatus Azobacteroides sp.]|nr:peptidoglycan DD-metalloendopeptidase family protein [Candidatus Azobacteroides sp.]
MRKLFLYFLFTCCILHLQAQRTEEFRDLQKRHRDMLLKIEETSLKLNEVDNNVTNSLQQLNLLNQKVLVRKQYIDGINREIAEIENNIEETKRNIDSQEMNLQKEKKVYAKIIQSMQKNNYYQNKLLFILSAKTLAQSYRRFEYLRELHTWQKKQLTTIKVRGEELENQKKTLEANRAEKLKLLALQQSEDLKLFEEEKKQQAIVNELLAQQTTLQTELKKQQEQESELNRMIEKMISGETEEEESGNEDTKSYERKLTENFRKNKGNLTFPVSGNYLITSHFGEKKFEELGQKTVNNGGIDIQALSGNYAIAIYEGIVSAIFTTPGYHSSIIVKHGDYLSVYANLSNIPVKKGDKVSAGQILGNIYKDSANGDLTVLHFQLREGKKRLNPEDWLKK